jgi:hypothetical protein
MRKFFLALSLCLASTLALAAQPAPKAEPKPARPASWRVRLAQELPLLGHRNWILVVDSAYPLQTSPGVETIETNSSQIDVVRTVLDAIARTPHVRPVLSMDTELAHIPDADAPGASAYRTQITALLKGHPIAYQPHDDLIAAVAQTGQQFHILVLKTTATVPYSSVFIRLDCRYWSADAEQRLRAAMKSAQH